MTLTETLSDHQPQFSENQTEPTTCYRHPTVETALRCNKCDRYICAQCAVRTPVGYRCKSCINEQQEVFFTATTRDYVIAAVTSAVLGGVLGFVLGQILFVAVILAAPAGGLISEVVSRLTGKRRGRYTGYAVVGGIIVGTVIASLPLILPLVADPANFDPSMLVVLAAPALYLLLCSLIAFNRFRVAI
jgi:MFS family permease